MAQCRVLRRYTDTGTAGAYAVFGSQGGGGQTVIYEGPADGAVEVGGAPYRMTGWNNVAVYTVEGIGVVTGSAYIQSVTVKDRHKLQVVWRSGPAISNISIGFSYVQQTVEETVDCTGVPGLDARDPGYRGAITQWQRPITGAVLPGVLGDRVEITDPEREWVTRPFLIESVRRIYESSGQGGRVRKSIKVVWGCIKLPGTGSQSGSNRVAQWDQVGNGWDIGEWGA